MDEKMKKLLTPINIGNVTVKNRFFVGPMGIDYNNGSLLRAHGGEHRILRGARQGRASAPFSPAA